MIASAGNRTRVNCLEGSYAHHYTTDALMVFFITDIRNFTYNNTGPEQLLSWQVSFYQKTPFS